MKWLVQESQIEQGARPLHILYIEQSQVLKKSQQLKPAPEAQLKSPPILQKIEDITNTKHKTIITSIIILSGVTSYEEGDPHFLALRES